MYSILHFFEILQLLQIPPACKLPNLLVARGAGGRGEALRFDPCSHIIDMRVSGFEA